MTTRSDALVVLVKRMFEAYPAKDRATVEALLADDFTFSSPYDDAIDRAEYFRRCWPNSETIAGFALRKILADDNEVFALYECRTGSGARFSNTEHFVFEGDKIKKIEVFFGDPPTGIAKKDYPAFVEQGQRHWKARAQA
jgi:ketosteroid isomerase-like protein